MHTGFSLDHSPRTGPTGAQTGHRRQCACEQALSERLNAGDLRLALKQDPEIAVPRNRTVFRTGDRADTLFIVCRGLLKLSHFTRRGEERVVRLLRPGDALGLECLTGHPYRHSAVALRDSTLCRIPASFVGGMLDGGPASPSGLFKLWQTSIDRADELLVEFGLGSARSRVARLLLLLGEEGPDAQCELFGRGDVGAILNLTPETVSRVITEFKQTAAITQLDVNRYRCDRPTLARVAERG
ncbi:MAG TPA: Crp/Fnr family transcriptional regulator [Azospirillum sp.]|nr:Crp/Fnr family transcriptional regulator [Azospirillum sp.]